MVSIYIPNTGSVSISVLDKQISNSCIHTFKITSVEAVLMLSNQERVLEHSTCCFDTTIQVVEHHYDNHNVTFIGDLNLTIRDYLLGNKLTKKLNTICKMPISLDKWYVPVKVCHRLEKNENGYYLSCKVAYEHKLINFYNQQGVIDVGKVLGGKGRNVKRLQLLITSVESVLNKEHFKFTNI